MFSRAIASQHTVSLVDANDYVQYPIIFRRNNLLLVKSSEYEIILPLSIDKSKNKAIRLYIGKYEVESRVIFDAYKNVIPLYFDIVQDKNALEVACAIMRDNPLFSIAHLLVSLDKSPLLYKDVVREQIDNQDCGKCPIMVAIENNKLSIVEHLIKLNCSMSIIDNTEKSILHYAARSDIKMLKCFLTQTSLFDRFLNCKDSSGLTPLNYACQSESVENLKILMDKGAFVDTSYSLYHCNYVSQLELLVNNNVDINAVATDGDTPLLHFVREQNFDCVVFLLSHGADPNVRNINRDNLLHIAVKKSDLHIIKALIVFGVDINAKNLQNQTPRHCIDTGRSDYSQILHILYSVGAKRCETAKGCSDICSPTGTNDGCIEYILDKELPELQLKQLLNTFAMDRTVENNRKIAGGRLLCLDGGGIRGLILIQTLMEMEVLSKKPIFSYFDWVAGTSTGGILALALASGKSLSECRRLYFVLKDKIFEGKQPHSSQKIEQFFKDHFGPNTCLSSITKPKLLLASVLYQQCPFKLHIHRNYPSPLDIICSKSSTAAVRKIPIWKAARATSAAPGYFDSIGIDQFMDGGLIANNPTLDALTDILEYGIALRSVGSMDTSPFATLVVSCGTGIPPTSESFTKTIDLFNFLIQNEQNTMLKIVSLGYTLFSMLKDIKNVIVDLITGSDERSAERAQAWCCMAGIPYYRINPYLSTDVQLNETNNAVIIQMLWETKAYLYENRSVIREAVDCLTLN